MEGTYEAFESDLRVFFEVGYAIFLPIHRHRASIFIENFISIQT